MSLEEKVQSLETQLAQALEVMAQLRERVRQLEGQLARANKNSANSSKPPFQRYHQAAPHGRWLLQSPQDRRADGASPARTQTFSTRAGR